MRPPAHIVVSAVLAVLSLVAVGCGTEDEISTAAGTETELTFALDTDGPGGKPSQEATLTCPGGDTDACAAVDALPDDATAPTDANQACTQVYGRPDTLTVDGTLRGEDVSAAFDRTDGCEIERFDRFTDVLTALYPDYDPTGGVDVN
jgi:hypothetical protein